VPLLVVREEELVVELHRHVGHVQGGGEVEVLLLEVTHRTGPVLDLYEVEDVLVLPR
jgi:hypothetical protein